MALLDGNNDVVLLKSNPEFSIYSIKGNEICLFVVPERVNMNLSMYLDLSMASDYTELLNGVKNQMQVVEKLDSDYQILHTSYENAVYVAPNFNTTPLSNAIAMNDKQAIFNAIGGIGNDTKKIQSILATKGITLDTKIQIVEKNNIDFSFANWLQSQNIGTGISFEELKGRVQNPGNPFMNSAVPSQNPFDVSGQVNQPVSGEAMNGSVVSPSVLPAQAELNIQNTQAIPVPTAVEGVTLQKPDLENEVATQTDASAKQGKLGNRGYVNIVILMVVLVGVTLLSIQLGKFLYSIYG